ncbi:hypothetical protein CWATWH8502_4435 [Crocosphaera watsonii WH 8502]|uniref:Uncharacterized protein n=4 Tax=Crocosphaera watsonii TaxID=263511 RepID=T2JLQ5_CROWT|nr:hypothetical protein CWATWH0003_2679 [Crocosphaera watsonii WH 0003]CCQ50977.1 hypothetical protein CWATWH8502_4435 [Crocosphaera watsonii WH 8502]CCQ61450.1 hypothetical protein CWATWH0401_4189 [Crocosphaera watsonii WH 0401]CCQ65432.1 hypothetical protein CWATWH0402_2906 [Crocosphaera watsonii WH 0402]
MQKESPTIIFDERWWSVQEGLGVSQETILLKPLALSKK